MHMYIYIYISTSEMICSHFSWSHVSFSDVISAAFSNTVCVCVRVCVCYNPHGKEPSSDKLGSFPL